MLFKEHSIFFQTIEWYYTEDNEKIWVPYPRHIKYLLEDAFITKGLFNLRCMAAKLLHLPHSTLELSVISTMLYFFHVLLLLF